MRTVLYALHRSCFPFLSLHSRAGLQNREMCSCGPAGLKRFIGRRFDELGEVVDDDGDDDEVLDDGDSSTAEVAKVSPGKRRRVHNETLPEEEDDAPLPKPSKRVAQA